MLAEETLDRDWEAFRNLAHATTGRPIDSQRDARLGREMSFVARSTRPATELVPEIRARIATIDDPVPIVRVAPMVGLLDGPIAAVDTTGRLLAGFALAGLFLLSFGLYDVVARNAHARQLEIGTRVAMGARSGQIVFVLLRNGGAILLAGIALGFAAVPLAASARSAQLGEALQIPTPAHPAAALLTLGAGSLVRLRPAIRAAAIEPMEVLRTE